MKTMFFTQAADDALSQAMAEDPRIIVSAKISLCSDEIFW